MNWSLPPLKRAAPRGKVRNMPTRSPGCLPTPAPTVPRPPPRRWRTCGRAPPKDLIDAARRHVFLKGTDAHDYKFSSAVLEDYGHLSPAWRDRFLATSLFYLPGSGKKDNDLVRRTRAALGGG